MKNSVRLRVIFLCVMTVAVVACVFSIFDPFPQPAWYHAFVDTREFFRIPNMMNVVSNLPFVVVGIWGLAFMAGAGSRLPGAFLDPRERWPFWVYFAGLALTGVGSAYYHAAPDNERLVWDRLPLMVTFIGLLASVLAERIDVRLATRSLVPLIGVAAGSVLQWHFSERAGAGDMRFYLTVQFYSIIVLIALIAMFRPRYTGTGDMVASIAAYAVAKVLEDMDGRIYDQAGFVSGHTLKHLVAGLGAYLILHMVQKRRPIDAQQTS